MKSKLTEEIREIIGQSVNWAKLELEYIKLTTSEKMVVLMSTLVLGGVMALLMLPVFIMFLFALVGVFRLIMPVPLAYLTVGGIVMLLIGALYMMRKPLVINPISRFVTKVILDTHRGSRRAQNP